MFSAIVLAGGSGGVGHGVFAVFIWILIGLIVYALGRYFFPKLGMPPIGMTVWDGLFILIAAIVIINFLAGLSGHQLFSY